MNTTLKPHDPKAMKEEYSRMLNKEAEEYVEMHSTEENFRDCVNEQTPKGVIDILGITYELYGVIRNIDPVRLNCMRADYHSFLMDEFEDIMTEDAKHMLRVQACFNLNMDMSESDKL